MPRTNIAVQVPDADGIVVALTAADAVNDNMGAAGSNVILLASNTGAVQRNIAIVTPGTVDGLAIADIAATIEAGEIKAFGPFPSKLFAQASGDDVGKVYFDADHAEVEFALLRIA